MYRLFLLLVLLLSVASGNQVIIPLTSDKWSTVVGGKRQHVIVLFTHDAQWCISCVEVGSAFRRLANSFKYATNVVFGFVDSGVDTDLVEKFKVESFPAIMLFPANSKEGTFYKGPNSVKELFKFLNKVAKTKIKTPEDDGPRRKIIKSKSPVVTLNNNNFASVVGSNKDVLVEFYAPWCGYCKKLAPIYEQLAYNFRDTKSVVISKIDATKSNAIAQQYDIKGYPTLKLFTKSDKQNPIDLPGAATLRKLTMFLNSKTGSKVEPPAPTPEELEEEKPSNVTTLSTENFDTVVMQEGRAALVEFYAPWCGHCKKLAPTYDQLAQLYRASEDKVIIANVDATAQSDLGKRFNISGYPTIKWFGSSDKNPVDYSGGRELEDFVEYINKETGLAVQPPREVTDVTILTDNNFDSIVGHSNVLVKFYAPWCGHCKAMAPAYEELAGRFLGNDNVVIAKLDATKHRKKTEAYEVKGYPTIKWFAKGDTVGTDYNGGRDVESLFEFVSASTQS